jgi:hypothetical protein
MGDGGGGGGGDDCLFLIANLSLCTGWMCRDRRLCTSITCRNLADI